MAIANPGMKVARICVNEDLELPSLASLTASRRAGHGKTGGPRVTQPGVGVARFLQPFKMIVRRVAAYFNFSAEETRKWETAEYKILKAVKSNNGGSYNIGYQSELGQPLTNRPT